MHIDSFSERAGMGVGVGLKRRIGKGRCMGRGIGTSMSGRRCGVRVGVYVCALDLPVAELNLRRCLREAKDRVHWHTPYVLN